MSEWLPIRDLSESMPLKTEKGVLLKVRMSPYDIPSAVRGKKASGGIFRIELQYIDGKELEGEKLAIDEHVSAVKGKYSHRLLAIEINVDRLGADAVGLEIQPVKPSTDRIEQLFERVAERALKDHASEAEKRNIASAEAAVKHRAKDLFEQMTPS